MAEITFRDFAGAVMAGNAEAAGKVLETLLGLDPAPAGAAAAHFQRQMTQAGPAFMAKAMGLRAAVEGGSDEDIRALLVDCFALDGAGATTAAATLRALR